VRRTYADGSCVLVTVGQAQRAKEGRGGLGILNSNTTEQFLKGMEGNATSAGSGGESIYQLV